MKNILLCFALFFVSTKFFAQDVTVTSAEYPDPFLAMQWILKNPDGKFLIHTKSFLGDDGVQYYYLPREFWADTMANRVIKEEIRIKFLRLFLPYAKWTETVSGIDYVLPLAMAMRETTRGTSERYVRSGGELFSIKRKAFQKSLGFVKGFYYPENGQDELFTQLYFGRNFTTLNSFKLFLFSITQKHYVNRLEDKGKYMALKVKDWRKGEYPKVTFVVYTPEIYLDCLCGHEDMNWAENCEGYDKTLAVVRSRLQKIEKKK